MRFCFVSLCVFSWTADPLGKTATGSGGRASAKKKKVIIDDSFSGDFDDDDEDDFGDDLDEVR